MTILVQKIAFKGRDEDDLSAFRAELKSIFDQSEVTEDESSVLFRFALTDEALEDLKATVRRNPNIERCEMVKLSSERLVALYGSHRLPRFQDRF